jgi:hypothetical protein
MAKTKCEICSVSLKRGMRVCCECSEEVCVVADRYNLSFAEGVQKVLDIRETSAMVSQMNSATVQRQIKRGVR